MSALTHFLVPASLSQLGERQKEITENVTSRLLTEGTFLHPSSVVNFYIPEITPKVVLRDVFLSDRRLPVRTTTYTAQEAYLVQDQSGPKLVMVNGLAQQHTLETKQLVTTNFADFSYDISALVESDEATRKEIKHRSTWDLLGRSSQVAQDAGAPVGWVVYEGHGRIAQALITIVFALVGFATLLLGGYSRFGIWRQIMVAFVLLIALEMAKGAVTDPVRANADLWPLIYLPLAVGTALAVILLRLAATPLRWRRVTAGPYIYILPASFSGCFSVFSRCFLC